MVDLILDILSMVLGPQTWRTMSGPAVAAGALVWGLVAMLVTIVGAVSLAQAGTTQSKLFAWAELVVGLMVLGDVVFGVSAFLRANRERA